jgi:hypothetical protein
MQSPKIRWWIAVVIGLTLVGVGLFIAAVTRPAPEQAHVCWDTPSSGTPPVKYLVTFDDGTPVVTTIECVRVPTELSPGKHVAVVRAVDARGQTSPPAFVAFSIP